MEDKRKGRAFLCMIVAIAMLSQLAVVTGPAGATVINTLGNGSSTATITFTGPGEDTSLYLTMPRMANVNSATIDIGGEPVKAASAQTDDFDFNDTDNNKAWSGTSNNDIAGSQNGPNSWQGSALAQGDYASISNSDDRHLINENKMASFSYHSFMFLVQMSDITQITVEWEGHGDAFDPTGVANNPGAQVHIWDNGTQAWIEVGTDESAGGRDGWIKNTYTGSLDGYLFNDVELRVVAANLYDSNSGYSGIFTDFVKVTVTGKPLEYPSAVTLDIGDDGSNEWTYPGDLRTVETYSELTFASALNAIIDAEGTGHGSFDIPLSISSATGGKVTIGGISIDITEYANEPPMVETIPSTFHMDEDTDAPDLIDLNDYFEDDIDPDVDLTYAIVEESDPDHLDAELDTDGLMSFTTPVEHWYGSATFKVKATDTLGAITESNEFTVTVDPVNDNPVLEPIGALEYDENEQVTLKVNATDPDKLFGGSDTLTFSAIFLSGSPLFTINSGTGMAYFIADDGDVGEYLINFTVTDAASESDSEIVTLTINDVNNPPELKAIGKKVLYEDEPFELQLEATDIDASDADALTYTVEFEPGASALSMTVTTDGLVEFTPVQADVGTHSVKFVVTDSGGLKDDETVAIDVRNVNDAPVLDPIPSQKVDRDTNFNLVVTATDEDIGYAASEVLTFEDDTDLFDIDTETGEIDFTPTVDDVGNYTITITVTDLVGATDTKTLALEVVLVNEAPVASIEVEGNKTTVKRGRDVVLKAVASDADDDPLTYKWFVKDEEVGTEQEVTLEKLKVGKNTVTLEVSDGITKTTVTEEIKVKEGDSGTPGFEGSLLLLALIVGVVVGIVLRRR